MIETPDTIQSIPLRRDGDGTIRVSDSRVTLDSIIHHFNLGATAEQIAHKFPSLALADIYAVIAYYLSNRQPVDDYLAQRAAAAAQRRNLAEQQPEYQQWKVQLRQRLLARKQQNS